MMTTIGIRIRIRRKRNDRAQISKKIREGQGLGIARIEQFNDRSVIVIRGDPRNKTIIRYNQIF